ncbi:MAG: hypothetical protein ABR499_01005, partial [Gemmatimonadaceae bacterium]
MIRRHLVCALIVALGVAPPLVPEAGAQDRGASIYPIPYRTIVGINPLGIPFEIGSIEVEGIVLPGISLGGAASYSALGDDDDDGLGEGDARYTSGDIKVRYYPGEVALRGFAVGLALGVTRFSKVVDRGPAAAPQFQREAVTAPTISVLADYNFLLGARERFVVGTGIGAKRLLAPEEDRDRADAPRAYAFLR